MQQQQQEQQSSSGSSAEPNLELLGVWFVLADGRRAVKFQSSRFALSNFYRAPLEIDLGWKTLKPPFRFVSSEQAYQAYKADRFGDRARLSKIMMATDPFVIKGLANHIDGYEERTWASVKASIMKEILEAKFRQNDSLRRLLLASGDAVLCEANARDRFWGIGLGLEDDGCADPAQWRGQNQLGKMLMKLRQLLREQQATLAAVRSRGLGLVPSKEQGQEVPHEDPYWAPKGAKFIKGDQGPKDWQKKSGNAEIVRKMLESMGFEEGRGLGKSGQGRKEPVPISENFGRLGLGNESLGPYPAGSQKGIVKKTGHARGTSDGHQEDVVQPEHRDAGGASKGHGLGCGRTRSTGGGARECVEGEEEGKNKQTNSLRLPMPKKGRGVFVFKPADDIPDGRNLPPPGPEPMDGVPPPSAEVIQVNPQVEGEQLGMGENPAGFIQNEEVQSEEEMEIEANNPNPIFQDLAEVVDEIGKKKVSDLETGSQHSNSSYGSFGNDGFAEPTNKTMADAVKTDKKGVRYLICQCQTDSVVACRRNASIVSWPFFIEISTEVAKKSGNFERNLQVGDEVSVQVFDWIEATRYLAAKEDEVSKSRKFWLNEATGLLPKQAAAVTINNIFYANSWWKPMLGLVYHVRRRVLNDPNTFVYAEVACCGLVTPSKVVRAQIDGIDLAEIKVGALVTVMCVNLPQGSLMEMRFVLPPGSPYKRGYERIPNQENPLGALAVIKKSDISWPNCRKDGTPILFPCPAGLNDIQIRGVEYIVGAALQVQAQRQYDKMVEARFEGTAEKVTDNEFTLVFKAGSKQEIRKFTDVWEIEALVQAKNELGGPHFAQGIILDSDLYSNGNRLEFWVRVSLNNIQERKKGDVWQEYEDFCSGGKAVVHPILPKSCEDQMACFRRNLPSSVAKEDSPRGKIMATLLGRPMEQGWRMTADDVNDEGDALLPEEAALSGSVRQLNGRQRATAKLMLQTGGLVHQQAPPGTGKTRVAAAVIDAVLEQKPDTKMLVVACANIPVTKLVQETADVCGGQRMKEVGNMALFSGTARVKYAAQVGELNDYTLKNKLDSAEFLKKISTTSRKMVLDYVTKCETKPRIIREREMGRLYNEVAKPSIRFMTIAVAADLVLGKGSISESEILVADESTQLQWAILVHLVAMLPNLKALLLTGDKRQLGVHLQSLPELFHEGYGLESVINQVEISPGTNYTFLTKMYRSHPMLVEMVSYAAYEPHGEKLIAARSAEERALLTDSQFTLPIQLCPVGLINAYSAHRPDPKSDSLTDDHQTEVALTLVKALLQVFGSQFASKIVVICMYTYQQELLDEVLGEFAVRCLTVDAYQAQENDVVIVVTTRSRDASLSEGKGASMDFFKDNRRATVALSRARHGIFLIGDLVSIAEGEVWARFIDKALEQTSVVRPPYVLDLVNRSIRRSADGTITGTNGDLLDNAFLSEWKQRGQTQGQGPSGSNQQPVGFRFMPEQFPPLARQPFVYRGSRGRRGPADRNLRYFGNPRRQRMD